MIPLEKNFSKDTDVYIPKVYWEYTTKRVLCLEEKEGIKISDREAVEKKLKAHIPIIKT